jgi:hypothetical protein
MRTFIAAVAGLAAAAALILVVMLVIDPGAGSILLVFLVLAFGSAALFGGFITAKIHTSPRAVSAFAVLDLFFTLAALSWRSSLPGSLRLLALLLVIPAAALGGKLAGAPVSDSSAARDDSAA